MAVDDSSFSVVDYGFFAAMLGVSLVIGAVATLKGNKSPEEFLMGNRAFGPLPIAMSLLTSFVSAISLLGFSGETYAFGMQIIWFNAGVIFGIAAAALIVLPVIHPLKLVSVNEYLQLRFKSPLLCKTVTLITVFNTILYMSIALYAPTLALATVTPLDSSTYILILGCVVTLYSSMGGIRAVVWTDVFQLTVMLVGLVIIVAVGCFEVGGPFVVWKTALEGGRLNIFDVTPSLHVRHTLWNATIFGFILCFSFFGVSQVNIQRLCTVPTMREAQLVLLINVFGMLLIYFLIFFAGVILYSAYVDCDPWVLGLLEKKEEILPHFMVDRLKYIIGLPGIFVATVVGGALSSVSSALNAVVALVWKDWLSSIRTFSGIRPRTAGLINVILSFIIGGIVIGVAFLSREATNLVQFSNTITSSALGPILGLFLLGLLSPKTNTKGAWAGIMFSCFFTGWIATGGFLYKPSAQPLPFSIDGCPSLNYSTTNIVLEELTTPTYPSNEENLATDTTSSHEIHSDDDFPLMKLYRISYTLYGFIGATLCIISGIIASWLTGNQDLKEISPEYVSPWVRKFYWGKDALERAYREEEKLTLLQENAVVAMPVNSGWIEHKL